MNTIIPLASFDKVELHLTAGFSFKGWDRRVKNAGGTYSDVRGHAIKRYVTIGTFHLALINDLIRAAQPSCVILRYGNQNVCDRTGRHNGDINLPKSIVSVLGDGPVTPSTRIEQYLSITLGTPAQDTMAQVAREAREQLAAEALLRRAADARASAVAKAAPQLLAALQVLTISCRAHLAQNDPQALKQALAAIGAATGELADLNDAVVAWESA